MVAAAAEVEYSGEYEEEPVSPTGQYLNSAALSVGILVTFELEEPIDEARAFAAIENLFVPASSRFSSIMVRDDRGVQQWRKVEVKLEDHVIIPTFPEGLDSYDQCVKDYLTELAAATLPPSRPMWQIHLIKYPTTAADGTGVFKLHHALGDGFSLMGALFSCVRRADDPSLPLTFPSTGGGAAAGRGRKSALRRWAAALPILVQFGINTVKDFGWSFLKSNLVKDDETPVRSGSTAGFQQMSISALDFSLEDIKKIKAKVGGTVNDVVTGIIFYGIRLFVQSAGGGATTKQSKSEVTALVLLNMRKVKGYRTIEEMARPEAQAPWGNRFAFLHVSIPKCKDPENAEPLGFVLHAKKTIIAKRSSLGVFLNSHLLELMRKLRGSEVTARYMWKSLRSTSMTISNLAGPVEKMCLSENPVRSFHYMVVGSPQSLTVTVVSYNGKLRVAVGAEKDFIDSDLLLSSFQKSFDKIYEAATVGPMS